MKYFINDFDSDCLILTEWIRDLEFIDNSRRKKINSDEGKTYSMLYGVTPYSILRSREPKTFREKDTKTNYYLTIGRSKYPVLQSVFEEFRDLHFKDFEFNSVMINKNLRTKKHKDGQNVGESIMLGLGDYSEGYLNIEQENKTYKKFKTWHKLIKFNGSKYEHFTSPFEGERFTLIFYKMSWTKKKDKKT